MEWGTLISFFVASGLLALMPGPDNIFILTESLTKGQRNGIAISMGIGSGVLVHTTAAATGVSIIIRESATAFSIIKYLGAFYFLYLAYQAFYENRPVLNLEAGQAPEKERLFPLLRKGFLMNVLNPKVSLFFIAFLPQFVVQDGWHVIMQMLVLGFIFMFQSVVIFSLIAMLSGKLTKYVTGANFWQIAKWIKIAVLVALGLSLFFAENI